MARPLRIEYEGALYHVTARGNERGKIFFSKRDYQKFREYLADVRAKYGFILHAYVLMSNHFHLIVETPQGNLGKIMHHLNGSYTTYFNIKRKRSGHLFQGRYKAILVDKDSYLLELSRYLHLNPVRTKMAVKPEEYPHSSYISYVSDQKDEIVTSDTILTMLTEEPVEARERYRIFVESALGEEQKSPLEKVYGGMILGKEGFIRETLSRLESKQREGVEVSHRKALRATQNTEETLSTLCLHYGITRETLTGAKRSEARKAGIYLLKKFTGATNSEIGELFGGLTYSAIAKCFQTFSQEVKNNRGLQERLKQVIEKSSSFKD